VKEVIDMIGRDVRTVMLFEGGWRCRGAPGKKTFMKVGTVHIETISQRPPAMRIRGLTRRILERFGFVPEQPCCKHVF
jgi:hypothetical protein